MTVALQATSKNHPSKRCGWWSRWESNPRPSHCERDEHSCSINNLVQFGLNQIGQIGRNSRAGVKFRPANTPRPSIGIITSALQLIAYRGSMLRPHFHTQRSNPCGL